MVEYLGHNRMAKPRFKNRASSDETPPECENSSNAIENNNIKLVDINLPWALKFEPQTLQELAMHPSKLEEIKNVLLPSSNTRILVLSGPSGSSKSTAIRLIAESRDQHLLEYHAPEASVGSTSLINAFNEFLLGAAMHDRNRTLILIEDLPSLFHENTRAAFEEALLQWSFEPFQPIVAISLTEIEVSAKFSDAIIVPRVFGNLIEDASAGNKVVWIKTNPLNLSLLQKAVQLVASKEGLSLPKSLLKALSQCGDVRSALNGLEFYSKSFNIFDKPIQSDALFARGTSIELFHAIGKIVWTSSKKGSLEESMEGLQDSLESFNLTVLENYTSAKHQRLPVHAAADVAEWLSIADICSPNRGLGALAAEKVISKSETCEDLPRVFVKIRYTQFPKWQSTMFTEQAKMQRSLKSLSLRTSPITQKAFREFRSYESQLPSRHSNPALFDSDSDDEF